MFPIQATPTGVRIAVHVQPRASRTELVGLHGDAIRLRLAAPPVEGAANEALVRFLAEALRVPRSAVAITAGRSGRRKVVTVAGVTAAEAARRLQLEPGTPT
jgi:uncharacterized protein (TIGR00251 family)